MNGEECDDGAGNGASAACTARVQARGVRRRLRAATASRPATSARTTARARPAWPAACSTCAATATRARARRATTATPSPATAATRRASSRRAATGWLDVGEACDDGQTRDNDDDCTDAVQAADLRRRLPSGRHRRGLRPRTRQQGHRRLHPRLQAARPAATTCVRENHEQCDDGVKNDDEAWCKVGLHRQRVRRRLQGAERRVRRRQRERRRRLHECVQERGVRRRLRPAGRGGATRATATPTTRCAPAPAPAGGSAAATAWCSRAWRQCDDGNPIDTDACVAQCKAATCGDGFLRMDLEQCDDGNGGRGRRLRRGVQDRARRAGQAGRGSAWRCPTGPTRARSRRWRASYLNVNNPNKVADDHAAGRHHPTWSATWCSSRSAPTSRYPHGDELLPAISSWPTTAQCSCSRRPRRPIEELPGAAPRRRAELSAELDKATPSPTTSTECQNDGACDYLPTTAPAPA